MSRDPPFDRGEISLTPGVRGGQRPRLDPRPGDLRDDEGMDDDLEQANAVAFVLAHVRGDEQAIETMLAMHEVRNLFAAVTGLLMRLLAEADVDAATVEAALTDWQERRRGSL